MVDHGAALHRADRLAQIRGEYEAGLDRYLETTGSARQALTIRLMLLKEQRAELEAQQSS